VSTILCIDTASETFALAVDRDGVMSSHAAEAQQDHSRLLLPAIKDLLGGGKPDAILVIIGPGAYAGVRVGIATAEGLSIAYDVPLYGIGTLEAAAAATSGEVTIIHPAGRGEFAVQDFKDGTSTGAIRLAGGGKLAYGAIAGQGAEAFGGTEVSPVRRCEAALAARAAQIRAGSMETGAVAFYLREPNITISRRVRTAAN
jgi:tRNA threonylcarbamoyl adenosine modification protein YeaZ